jgi:hypothetical protein
MVCAKSRMGRTMAFALSLMAIATPSGKPMMIDTRMDSIMMLSVSSIKFHRPNEPIKRTSVP